MQSLILTQKENRYDVELLFLHELINVFTIKSNIRNRNFYSKINKSLKHVLILSNLSYNEHGLLSFESVFENYKKAKKSENALYETTPYFSSLSRLLALIYSEASSILGEEKAKNILKASFNVVKKKYSEIPDLEGYIPKEVLGKATSASAAYSTILTDNIIKYYVGIIKKGVKPEQITAEPRLQPILKEIEENQKLPPEEKDYLYLCLELEDYIVKSNLGYTTESLRATIKEKFNTQWIASRVRALFNLKEVDHSIFSEIILEAILKYLRDNISPNVLQKIVNEITKNQLIDGIIITKEKIDFTVPEIKIFSDETQFNQVIKNINELLTALYSYSTNNVGASRTKQIFSTAFNELKSKYINFPKFIDAVRSLPTGILEEEKFSLLSKEELEKVSRKLARIDVMKSEFTNIAAHELKTPIIPLKGFLRRMKKYPKKYGLNKIAKEHIDICLRNVERLDNLVGDILDISKLEAEEMKFEIENVNLVFLLHNVITDISSLSKEKNLILKTKIPKTLSLVYGDTKRLTQVLSNLINNAIKFTDKGSVTVNAKLVGNNIQVDIIDTGMGIAKENIPKLFIKFFQTQEAATRKTKGTGLGLAICKEIITAHKGKIWAKSEGLGKGSAFSFTIPIKPREKRKESKKKVKKPKQLVVKKQIR